MYSIVIDNIVFTFDANTFRYDIDKNLTTCTRTNIMVIIFEIQSFPKRGQFSSYR